MLREILDEREFMVLWANAAFDYGQAEIAHAMNISQQRVAKILSEAKAKIQAAGQVYNVEIEAPLCFDIDAFLGNPEPWLKGRRG